MVLQIISTTFLPNRILCKHDLVQLGMARGVPRSLFPEVPDFFHSPIHQGIEFITPRFLKVLAKIPQEPRKGNFLDLSHLF